MNKKTIIIMLVCVLCFPLWGCNLQKKIEEYSSDKVPCYLNKDNVTQFSYLDNNYTILEETVSNSGLGEWVGYIRQLVAIDENGKVLFQENMEDASFQTISDLADAIPEAAYTISFLNVYAAPNTDTYLIVDVNGEYHKAMINTNIKDTDIIFDFREVIKSTNKKVQINPENATQILLNGNIYQITSDIVSDDELGNYIDILAENVTFDTETKRPLSKEDLKKFDWTGKESNQGREQWIYKDVYEIYGIDKTEAVAVKVNNSYYIANRQ